MQPANMPLSQREFAMNVTDMPRIEEPQPDLLTETIQSKLGNPERSSDIDLHGALNDVLKDVGMSAVDSGGKLSFYGRDPIIPSPHRFGSMAAIGLAAKAVAVAALWRHRTGEGQDIAVDVRKALRRFCGFFELKWETINGRPPAVLENPLNPFIDPNLFHETRDGRHVVAINIYPELAAPARIPYEKPFCSGIQTIWRARRPRPGFPSPRCAPSRSSAMSFNTP
jgi:hypothetical protein